MDGVGERMGLRERKKHETRRMLRTRALRLFATSGFDHVTVDDVATACDVSRATVFRYFSTKEDLVVSNERGRLDEVRVAFEDRPAGEAVFDSIRHALLAVATAYEHDRSEIVAVRALVATNPSLLARALEHEAEWTATFAGLISARSSGSDAADLRAHVLAAAVTAALRVTVDAWLVSDADTDLPALLATTLDLLAGGFEAV